MGQSAGEPKTSYCLNGALGPEKTFVIPSREAAHFRWYGYEKQSSTLFIKSKLLLNLPIALVELHYETYKNNVLRVSRSTLFNIKASGITNLFYSLLKVQQYVLVIISIQENS